MQPDPKALAQVDPPYWAYFKQVRIDGRPFDLKGRKYQQEIMRFTTDDGKEKHREVIKKGTQIGITMIKVVEACHGATYSIYPQGVIFYFPSLDAVQKFSQRRFKPFVTDNDEIRRSIDDVNSMSTRRIGNVNISFEGASATSRVGGEKKDSTSVRSTPADWIALDERDLFDDEMAAQVDQRLGNSKISRRTDIGSPTMPDFGIDRAYEKSDQRLWQIKCQACSKYTCVEQEFPNCIKLDSEGNGYIACKNCGKPINPSGEGSLWVPSYKDRDVAGYWASQLLNPNRNLALVLKIYADPEAYDTTIAEVYRTILGSAYASSEDMLTEQDVYSCCGRYPMLQSHPGPCAMGVDVDDPLHAVIGVKRGHEQYEIIKMVRVPDFGALADVARRFNVRVTVIDAQPDIHAPREFQRRYNFGTYLCHYTPHLKAFHQWDEKKRMVKVNRTEIFSFTHRMALEAGRLTIPRYCEEVKIFAHQMTCAAKFLEESKMSGGYVYRWKKVGDKQDHYRNALNYFVLACRKVGVPQDIKKKPQFTEQECEVIL